MWSPRLALLCACLLGSAPALAAQPPATEGGLPNRDVRDGTAAEAAAQARTEDDAVGGQERAAAALVRREGRLASLTTDPTTGTVRVLLDAGGALSGPSDESPARTARDYVAAHLTALGLSAADLDTLGSADVTTTTDGVTHVRWRQVVDGIPAFDNGLAVDLDRGGRVLTVTGAPVHAPQLNRTDPALSAGDAAGVVGGAGATARAAELVAFDANGRQRLAWHVRVQDGPTADYDAVVDAVTGRLLRRVNLVKFLWKVFPHYPGAAAGGAQVDLDLGPYLASGATTLTGPYAHAYADLNDNDQAGPGEETDPTAATGVFTSFPGGPSSGCSAQALCSWDPTAPSGWSTNRDQNAIQAFWFVSAFHDHLATAPIGFDDFVGSTGRVIVNTDDGADGTGHLPDSDHVNNANMSTPATGQPRMQMYLFSGSGFRDVNGGDAAEVVYHEYTHGLSGRLVHDAGGNGALNSAQAGAMGEAWSDWYAMDFLARPDAAGGVGALLTDTGAPGEIDLGAYTDATPNQIRSQPLDCPVNSTDPKCPGLGPSDRGGYTYGDFGKVCPCGPEVHADGEIWGETLWDLRAARIASLGSVTAGSNETEQLVTGAMRVSPPEPSFLDMRNALLVEATAMGNPSGLRDAIWSVFTARGMGFFAGTLDGSDTAPAESFEALPAPGASGQIAGRVTDAVTGRPVAGARIAIGGHTSGETTNVFTATSAADGSYTLGSLPPGTYREVVITTDTGHTSQIATDLAVTNGGTLARDFALRRDWAALAAGGSISADTDATAASAGCGPEAAIDQSQGIGWSAYNPASSKIPAPDATNHLVPGQPPSMTIQLPQATDISAIEADPGATCGDRPSATAKGYRIETSQDGTTFTTASEGQFASSDAGTMTSVPLAAGSTGAVRFVRVTLLSPQDDCSNCSGKDFVDLTELAVYGNALPQGSLSVPDTAVAGQPVTLDASAFSDDGTIASYAWDFDGDGMIDATTSAPATTHTYAAEGIFAPRVVVTDNSGGATAASASIAVLAAPVTPPKPVVKRKRPSIALPAQTANRVTFRVTCQNRCAGTASIKVGKALAKRLHLRSWTVGRATVRLRAGRHTVRLAIRRDVLRLMRAKHLRSARLTLAVSLRDANGLRASFTRRPSIRIR